MAGQIYEGLKFSWYRGVLYPSSCPAWMVNVSHIANPDFFCRRVTLYYVRNRFSMRIKLSPCRLETNIDRSYEFLLTGDVVKVKTCRQSKDADSKFA